MPAGREKVVNQTLSGSELKQIILRDFTTLLDNHGLLSHQIAYGRVGYQLILKLHVDNAMRPDGTIEMSSRAPARNIVDKHPELTAVESAPLASPSLDAVIDAVQVTREIDSPNAERLRNGIPIPVQRRQDDGTIITEQVTYPPSDESGAGNIKVDDVSAAADVDWNSVR